MRRFPARALTRRLVGAAELIPVGVVLDVLHKLGVNAAAPLHDHAHALIVEHPYLYSRGTRVGLLNTEVSLPRQNFALPSAVSSRSPGPLVKLVLDGVFLEFLPVLVVGLYNIVGLYHFFILRFLFLPCWRHHVRITMFTGRSFHKSYLHSLREAQHGNVLPLFQILHRLFHDLLRRVVAVEVIDGVVMYGVAEKTPSLSSRGRPSSRVCPCPSAPPQGRARSSAHRP